MGCSKSSRENHGGMKQRTAGEQQEKSRWMRKEMKENERKPGITIVLNGGLMNKEL